MQTKTCTLCRKRKTLSAFYLEKAGKYGRRSRCINCFGRLDKVRSSRPEVRASHAAKARRWRVANPEKARDASRRNQLRYVHELRSRVLACLGNRCACCPVDDTDVLHVDHPNRDGWVDRLAFTGRAAFLRYVLAFPTLFRLLCANCNHRHRIEHTPPAATKTATYQRKYQQKLRTAAFAALGNVCKNCPETDPVVLCVDHKEGSGSQDRRRLGGSKPMYKDVVQNPAKYQLLCHNCNWEKRHRCREYGGKRKDPAA